METDEIFSKIDKYIENAKNVLPSHDEINNFSNRLAELFFEIEEAALISRVKEEYTKNVSDFNSISVRKSDFRLSDMKEEIDELSRKLAKENEDFKEKLEEKSRSESSIQDLEENVQEIAFYKHSTLSNFSFNKKYKYGYFLDKETSTTKTFQVDVMKSDADSIEEHWDYLNGFISTASIDQLSTLRMR